MTREDIIRMAEEAGFNQILATYAGADVWIDDGFYVKELERFAALVAAAEREACARVCEGRANGYQYATDPYAHEHITEANYCAAAIRARGDDEPR